MNDRLHWIYDHVAKYVEQLGHDRCVARFSKGCHDPMATPVGKLHNGDDRNFMHDEI